MRHILALHRHRRRRRRCGDPVSPIGARNSLAGPSVNAPLTAQSIFARYVALGTSDSMGVQSAGIFASGQRAAWPAQLAALAGAPFSLPLVQDPGCGPPLQPPLALDAVLVGAFGNDLVTAVMTTCARLQSGMTLPANNVTISRGRCSRRALQHHLVGGHHDQNRCPLQSCALARADAGRRDARPATDVRIRQARGQRRPSREHRSHLRDDAVRGLGARLRSGGCRRPEHAACAVLVGLPNDAANFPSIRRARELFNEWPSLLPLGISVSLKCYLSSNYVFVPGYMLRAFVKTPTTATCADVPGAADYVLTASDMSAINARMAQMNAHMRAKAAENGYAYFSLDALYGLAKPRFSVSNLLFSTRRSARTSAWTASIRAHRDRAFSRPRPPRRSARRMEPRSASRSGSAHLRLVASGANGSGALLSAAPVL